VFSSSRRLGVSILVVLGLALIASGSQTEVRRESPEGQSAGPTLVRKVRIVNKLVMPPEVDALIEEQPLDTALPAEPVLSPRATRVVELPSALPERLLADFGEEIGRPPTTLSLPDLGVSAAPILAVGLEENGELEIPQVDEVGWYQFGAGVDGGRGSTVLASHIAYNGRNGVFRNLAETEIGDEIIVGLDADAIPYRVVSVEQYSKTELPIDDLFSESSEERLVLITCGGLFNPGLASYDDNIVVIAIPA